MPDSPFFFHSMSNVPNVLGVTWATMRKIVCPFTKELLEDLYLNQKLTDKEIAQKLIGPQEKTGKRVRIWRIDFGIPTINRTDRNEITPIEGDLQSLLVGSMLGDGRLVRNPKSTFFTETHCEAQRPYLEWKKNIWGVWSPKEIKDMMWNGSRSDREYPGCFMSTVGHESLNPWHSLFYPEKGPKQFSDPRITDLVDPFALAIWFLDDGTAGWQPSFAFGLKGDSWNRCNEIFEKFGFKLHWRLHSGSETTGCFSFRDVEESYRFRELIKPFVPECMVSKLEFGCLQTDRWDKRRGLKEREEEIRKMCSDSVPLKIMMSKLGVGHSALNRFLKENDIFHSRKSGYPGQSRAFFDNFDHETWNQASSEEKVVIENEIVARLGLLGFPSDPRNESLEATFKKVERKKTHLDDEGFIHPQSPLGTKVLKPYFPNRYDAKWWGSKRTAREAWADKETLLKAVRYQLAYGDPILPNRVLQAVCFLNRTPTIFRPLVMKYMVETYTQPEDWVWDPCMGYGGRLFGALAAGRRYVGTEIEEKTCDGNRQLAHDLGKEDSCVLIHGRAQDFMFDQPLSLAFTSPPYYKTEQYGEDPMVDDYNGWVQGFLVPVIEKAHTHLKRGGAFAMNVAAVTIGRNRYDIPETLKAEALKCGFEFETELRMPLSGVKKFEPILVFRKL